MSIQTDPSEMTDAELIERVAALDPDTVPVAERCRELQEESL